MHIRCKASHVFPHPAQRVFELAVDPVRFPLVFPGFGPISAIRSITLDGPLRCGTLRRLQNADGSQLTEQVTALDPPRLHGYSLGGFKPPFSWLVARGEATWLLSEDADGTRVEWRYLFSATNALSYPLAALLLHLCMTRAMRRCLRSMDGLLSAETIGVTG